MAIKNNNLQVAQYEYSFSQDGGAIGTITLSNKANKNPIKAGSIIRGVSVWAKEAVTATGAATVSVGLASDVDSLVAATAKTSLALNDVVIGAGAGVNTYVSADSAVTVSIAVDALLTGSLVISVEFIAPAA